VVWAKNEEGRIHGLIVERGMEGFTTPETHNKWSLRASSTGELVFDNVKVPKENLLPNKSGLGAPMGCLDSARYGIAWGALGAAMDCYDTALRYSKERIQFDRPIGGFQLQQRGQDRPAGELPRQLRIGQQLQACQGGVVAFQPVEQAVVGRRRQQQEGLGHQPAPGPATGGALAGICCSQAVTGIGWFWA
jgi:hypothetical protein